MELRASFPPRRGAAADRYLRMTARQDGGGTSPSSPSPGSASASSSASSSDDRHAPCTERQSDADAREKKQADGTHSGEEDGRRAGSARGGDEGGSEEGTEAAVFVPSSAVEQVLHDPYLLLEIFHRLFASFSASAVDGGGDKSSACTDHVRPVYRRLRNVRQVCALWHAVARLILPPTDYIRARPSCYVLCEGDTSQLSSVFNSSLLSLAVLPLPAMGFPTDSREPSETSPPDSNAPAKPVECRQSPATKLYLVSGYSEGEVKIWDVDTRGPNGSHCVKTLQNPSSRWFCRHFRSMALASLVDLPPPTYPLGPVQQDPAPEPKPQQVTRRKPLSNSGSGFIARLNASAHFSLARQSTESQQPTRSRAVSCSDSSESLLLRSADNLPTTRQRKKSWFAKKLERKSSRPALDAAPPSPRAYELSRCSSRQEVPRLLYSSAPITPGRRDRYSYFRGQIIAQNANAESGTAKNADHREEEIQKPDNEPNLATATDDTPEAEQREHLASVYYHLVLIWDVVKGIVLRTLEGHGLEVNALQALKGGRLASGSEDKSIRIWDVRTGQCLRVLQRVMSILRSPVLSLATLPNGRLVSGAENNKITVWDVDSGKRIDTLKGATEPVWHFQVLREETGLFPDPSDIKNNIRLISSTGHWDPDKRTSKGQVSVWDVKNARKMKTVFEYDGYARNMIGLPGGYLAVAYHYYGSANPRARLLIIDLNNLDASTPHSTPSTDIDTPPLLPRSDMEDSSTESEPDSQADHVDQLLEEEDDLLSWGDDSIPGRQSSADVNNRNLYILGVPSHSRYWITGSDNILRPESDDESRGGGDDRPTKENANKTEEGEEGDGRTWRLVPGTMNLKVNAMAVMPDGRLIGASSDGSIRVWDFSTAER